MCGSYYHVRSNETLGVTKNLRDGALPSRELYILLVPKL
jgi:hypothetical protein